MSSNRDERVIAGFGDEWKRFDQSAVASDQLDAIFNQYFSIFPWEIVSKDACGADIGCGSGRWAVRVAPRVGHLYCVDPSLEALAVAQSNLMNFPNVAFILGDSETTQIPDYSLDFAYSLGVLHHAPNTAEALRACVRKLKLGAPILIYLYYALDDKPRWFKALWQVSDVLRKYIANRSPRVRYFLSQLLAFTAYLPLARSAALLEKCGYSVNAFPLSEYRSRPLYVMRNDALDRFGTRLEQRFSKPQILQMMEGAGLDEIRFSDGPPFWCAVGTRVS